MKATKTKRQQFSEIALSKLKGRKVTIDEMRSIYEEAGFFADDEIDAAARAYKNKQLRRLARLPLLDEWGDPLTSSDGSTLEIVNIPRAGAGSDERQNAFMFIQDTTQEDLEFLIKGHARSVVSHREEMDRLIGIYANRYGRQAARLLQKRLDFGTSPEAN